MKMRYLGIDYGEQKIGLALSDEQGTIAFPYGVVGGLDEVCVAISKEDVGAVIIGLPLSSAGEEGKQAEETRRFAAKLANRLELQKADGREAVIAVEFENELLTTKLAEQHTARDKAHASAAALILQSYLDGHRAR